MKNNVFKYCIVNKTVTIFAVNAPSGQNNRFFDNFHAIHFLLELDHIEKDWIKHQLLVQLNDEINSLCERFFFEAGE
jgi:hypothetical protein